MRVAGVFALLFGIVSALAGLAYSAFVTLREWTPMKMEQVAERDAPPTRVAATEGRRYWAAIQLSGTVLKKPVDHDIALRAAVVDASNAELRTIDVHLDANEPLPACMRFSDEAPCAVVSLDGPLRDRITFTLQVAPVTVTKTGELTYVIDVSKDARGGVAIENATITVYRSSREEAIKGLVVALVGIVIAGIAHRVRRRA